jgi:hypothetical protein
VTDGRHLNAPAFAIQTWSGAFFSNDQDPERRRSNISSLNAAYKRKTFDLRACFFGVRIRHPSDAVAEDRFPELTLVNANPGLQTGFMMDNTLRK